VKYHFLYYLGRTVHGTNRLGTKRPYIARYYW